MKGDLSKQCNSVGDIEILCSLKIETFFMLGVQYGTHQLISNKKKHFHQLHQHNVELDHHLYISNRFFHPNPHVTFSDALQIKKIFYKNSNMEFPSCVF